MANAAHEAASTKEARREVLELVGSREFRDLYFMGLFISGGWGI